MTQQTNLSATFQAIGAVLGSLNNRMASTGEAAPNSDIDQIVLPGSYAITSTTVTNSAELTALGAVSGSHVFHFQYSETFSTQIFSLRPANVLYYRIQESGVWGPIHKLAREDEVLLRSELLNGSGGELILGSTDGSSVAGQDLGSLLFYNGEQSTGGSGKRIGGSVKLVAQDQYGDADLVIGVNTTDPITVFDGPADYADNTIEAMRFVGDAAPWIKVSAPTEFFGAATFRDAATTFDGGVNTTVDVVSDDAGESVVNIVGPGQGTGRLYVGQSYNHGGGIEYNGDGTPVSSGTTDKVSLFARNNGVNKEVAHWSYSGLDFIFPSGVAVKAAESLTVADVDAYADEGFTVSGNTPNVRLRQDDNGNSAVQLAHNGGMFYVLADADGNGNWESIPLEIQVDGVAEHFEVYGHTVWHSGNDGAGSGLDADRLDGLDLGAVREQMTVQDVRVVPGTTGASDYMPKPEDANLHNKNVVAYFSADTSHPVGGWNSYLTVSGWSGAYTTWQLVGPSDATLAADDDWFLRAGDGTSWGAFNRIWHSGNDDDLAKVEGGKLQSTPRLRDKGPTDTFDDAGSSTRYSRMELPAVFTHAPQLQSGGDWVIQLPGEGNNTFFNGVIRFQRNYHEAVDVRFHGYFKSNGTWNTASTSGGSSENLDFARFIRFGKDAAGNPCVSISNEDEPITSSWSNYVSVEIIEVVTGWTGAVATEAKDPASYKVLFNETDDGFTWQYKLDLKPALSMINRRRYVDVADFTPTSDLADHRPGIAAAMLEGNGREIVFTNPIGSLKKYRCTDRTGGNEGRILLPQFGRIIFEDGAKVISDYAAPANGAAGDPFFEYQGGWGNSYSVTSNAFKGSHVIPVGSTNAGAISIAIAVNEGRPVLCHIQSLDRFTLDEFTPGTPDVELGYAGEFVMVTGVDPLNSSQVQIADPLKFTYTSSPVLKVGFDTASEKSTLGLLRIENPQMIGPGKIPGTGITGDVAIQIKDAAKVVIEGGSIEGFDKHSVFLSAVRDWTLRGVNMYIDPIRSFGDDPTQYPFAMANSCDFGLLTECTMTGGRETASLTTTGGTIGVSRNVHIYKNHMLSARRSGFASHDNHEGLVIESNLTEDCEQFYDIRVRDVQMFNNIGKRSGWFGQAYYTDDQNDTNDPAKLDCAVQLASGSGKLVARGNVWEDVLRGWWLPQLDHESAPGDFLVDDDTILGNRTQQGALLDFRGSTRTPNSTTLGRAQFTRVNWNLRNTDSFNRAVYAQGKWTDFTVTGTVTGGNPSSKSSIVYAAGDKVGGGLNGPINPRIDLLYDVTGFDGAQILNFTGKKSVLEKGIDGKAPNEVGDIITANDYWDVPSMVPQGWNYTDITVPGASLGDFVEVTSPALMGGVMLHAEATATDTVRVHAFNMTGSTLNPTGAQVYIKLTKRLA